MLSQPRDAFSGSGSLISGLTISSALLPFHFCDAILARGQAVSATLQGSILLQYHPPVLPSGGAKASLRPPISRLNGAFESTAVLRKLAGTQAGYLPWAGTRLERSCGG